MALRLAFKINSSNIFQNSGKYFYTRKATEPNLTVQNRNETNKIQTRSKENVGMPPQVYHSAIPNLIRHTNASESERHDTEAKLLQHRISQQLQPAMLPKYQPAINGEADNFSKAPESYRPFEKSLTYRSVKLPLKKPKLANPFPDPVKVIESDIVSDQEKAEQMQATARFPSTQIRHYSTTSRDGDESCPKIPATKCENHLLMNCPPRARKYCQPAHPDVNFKKQDAPYPSYSESCHTVLDEKLSECKLCPWKPKNKQ